MAFLKSMETKFGVNALYWRVERFEFNKSSNVISATVAGYLNKDAAREGKSILDVKNYTFIIHTDQDGISDWDMYSNVPQQLYIRIASENAEIWGDAIADIEE